MNGLYKFRGLMLIALWQTAPPVAKTEDGRLQIGLGYGSSRIDEVFFTGGTDCAGTDNGPLVEHRVTHRPKSFGASVRGMVSQRLRVGAAYNTTTADTTTLAGGQLKALVAMEWKYFGAGTGFTTYSPEPLWGVYLRGGPINSVHVRLDMPDLSQPTSTTGVGRVGIAYNQTDRGFGAFLRSEEHTSELQSQS